MNLEMTKEIFLRRFTTIGTGVNVTVQEAWTILGINKSLFYELQKETGNSGLPTGGSVRHNANTLWDLYLYMINRV